MLSGENLNQSLVCIKGKTLLLIFLVAFLLVGINKVDVVAASETTHFFVDPPEVTDVMPPNEFLTTINVTEAPETFSWEISLNWDPDLLELTSLEEGDFLHRWEWDEWEQKWVHKYSTNFFGGESLDEANLNGQIIIGCSLMGALPMSEWATGNGTLCSLGFTVEAQGSCVLDLLDTRLYDHMSEGYPAYTYYSNLDGFFYNVDVHDIAVTNVVPFPTEVTAGENVAINVTVKNDGIFDETFNLTVYADLDSSVIADEISIGTQTNIPIGKGASTTVTFTWDTNGVAGGNYTISARAIIAVDDEPTDNLFTDGTVKVQGAPPSDILLYIAVAVVIIVIVAAIAVYFIKFRKPT